MVNQQSIDGRLRKIELFAGAGGGILASNMLGIRTVCCVEYDSYAAAVLLSRQNDGTFDPCPVWDDVRTFDGKPWRGAVDVVSGGFPCTDISSAGKGAGIEGENSRMWFEMARIIGEVLPSIVFVENSPMLVGRGLTRVISDLATLGYDAKWCIVSASDIGAPHQRDRIWIKAKRRDILAYAEDWRTGWREQQQGSIEKAENGIIPNSNMQLDTTSGLSERGDKKYSESHACSSWWESEPANEDQSTICRMVDGVANWSHRVKCLGNGQVPLSAATAWELLD